MKKSKPAETVTHGLKIYSVANDALSGWIVSGPAEKNGKRWRRTFTTKELAEEYFRRESEKWSPESKGESNVFEGVPAESIEGKTRGEQSPENETQEFPSKEKREFDVCEKANERRGQRCGKKGSEKSAKPLERRLFIGLCILSILGFWLDQKFGRDQQNNMGAQLLFSDFEANPLLGGWEPSGDGVEWSEDERVSGRASIRVCNGSWRSKVVCGELGQWYRLGFRAKSPENQNDDELSSGGNAEIIFFDDRGRPIGGELAFLVPKIKRWQLNEFRFRAQAVVDGEGAMHAASMAVRFSAHESPYFVDEVVVEKLTREEVVKWADDVYENFPTRLSYRPSEMRWQMLPEFMAKLEAHRKVRILTFGDISLYEAVNGPLDKLIERLYPGCKVEILSRFCIAGHGASGVTPTLEIIDICKPDLLLVGGEDCEKDVVLTEKLIESLSSYQQVGQRHTEVLLLSKSSFLNSSLVRSPRFSSDTKILTQEVTAELSLHDDPRVRLMNIASKNNFEFLDMMGIVSEYIYGSATSASAALPTNADGVPYGFRGRDWFQPKVMSQHIMCRVLEAYFAPKHESRVLGTRGDSYRDENIGKGNQSDSGLNPALVVDAKKKFEVTMLERPVFVRLFEQVESLGQSDLKSDKSLTFRLGNDSRNAVGYNFSSTADVKRGDLAVYWSFSSDATQGEEKSKLGMHLSFSEPTRIGQLGRTSVSLIVRPRGASTLAIGSELMEADTGIECAVEVPVENFVDASREAKFRMLIRWAGGDRILVEAASWSARNKRWEGFIPSERPGAAPIALEVSIEKNFKGNTAFNALVIETFSSVPKIKSILVTTRPSLVR